MEKSELMDMLERLVVAVEIIAVSLKDSSDLAREKDARKSSIEKKIIFGNKEALKLQKKVDKEIGPGIDASHITEKQISSFRLLAGDIKTIGGTINIKRATDLLIEKKMYSRKHTAKRAISRMENRGMITITPKGIMLCGS